MFEQMQSLNVFLRTKDYKERTEKLTLWSPNGAELELYTVSLSVFS